MQAWATLEARCNNIAHARHLFDAAVTANGSHAASWHGWGLLEKRQVLAPSSQCLIKALPCIPWPTVSSFALTLLEGYVHLRCILPHSSWRAARAAAVHLQGRLPACCFVWSQASACCLCKWSFLAMLLPVQQCTVACAGQSAACTRHLAAGHQAHHQLAQPLPVPVSCSAGGRDGPDQGVAQVVPGGHAAVQGRRAPWHLAGLGADGGPAG